MSEWSVLLVEDDPNDVMLMQRAFKKANVSPSVEVASDGEQAIAALADTTVPRALVLLDLKLPRKSGFEVLQWLRAQPALKGLPVVILSSSREPQDIKRAYELGANSYLVKPGAFDDLQALVKMAGDYWLVLNQRART